MEWRIRNIDPEVKVYVKRLARDAGMSVGGYLNMVFTGRAVVDAGGGEWRLKNVRAETKNKLKKRASVRGLSLADYLEFVADIESKSIGPNDLDALEEQYESAGREVRKIGEAILALKNQS